MSLQVTFFFLIFKIRMDLSLRFKFRFVQDPLSEYANMWCSADALGNFGHEVLFLDLHPHKVNLRILLLGHIHNKFYK